MVMILTNLPESNLVPRCCSSRCMTITFVALRRSSQEQQVSAVRIRSSSSAGSRRSLHLTNLMNRSSTRSFKDVEAHNLLEIAIHVPEMTWRQQRNSVCANGTQAAGVGALAVLG